MRTSLRCALIAVIIASSAALARPLPQWEYNTSHLPVGWFGANASGFENESQLDQISRYDLAIFGWQAFLTASNYTHEAEHLVAQAQVVKARNPSKPVAIYLDAQLAEPFQTSVLAAMQDPQYQVAHTRPLHT
jgi:hypothetical protein